jgi:hypothetical protein
LMKLREFGQGAGDAGLAPGWRIGNGKRTLRRFPVFSAEQSEDISSVWVALGTGLS